MRYFLPAVGLAALLLAGCGNDNGTQNTFVTNSTAQPSPVDPGLPLNAGNGLSATTTMLQMVHTDGGGHETSGQPLSFIEAANPLATAEEIQASYGGLLARGSGTVNGAAGGSYTSSVNGSLVSVVFNGYDTGEGSVTGSVVYSGGTNPAGFLSNSTFSSLQVAPRAGHTYRLDGGGSYSSTRAASGTFTNVFGSNATVTEANGGTARYINFTTTANVSATTTDSANGVINQVGRILFTQFDGLTGSVEVSNPQVQTWQDGILFRGQWLFAGSGQTRASATGPNTMQIEAAPPSGQFSVLGVVDLGTIIGQ